MKSVLQILTQARRLVKRGWCKGALARTVKGSVCSDDDPEAVEWCAFGAIWKASGRLPNRKALTCLQRSIRRDIGIWNDAWGRTKAQVLSAFDRAIALARRAK